VRVRLPDARILGSGNHCCTAIAFQYVDIALQHLHAMPSSPGSPIPSISHAKVHTLQTQSWSGFAGGGKIAQRVFSDAPTMQGKGCKAVFIRVFWPA
jgi:hypothetical protein